MAVRKPAAADPSTELVQKDPFTTEQYAAITDFASAVALLESEYGHVVKAHEEPILSDGFRLISKDDKWRYVDKPLVLLNWKFLTSDKYKNRETGDPAEYVLIRAVAYVKEGPAEKILITDGGAGIYRDLKAYTDQTGRYGNLGLNHGLRSSTYENEFGEGETFYLDFSA